MLRVPARPPGQRQRGRWRRRTGALNTRAGLARWTREAGDAGRARDQYATLLPIYERVLGPEHPDTLYTRAGLARFTGEAKDGSAPGRISYRLSDGPVRARVTALTSAG